MGKKESLPKTADSHDDAGPNAAIRYGQAGVRGEREGEEVAKAETKPTP